MSEPATPLDLAAIKARAHAAGGSRSLLELALRIINRHNLTDEYVEELLRARGGRSAVPADFGLPETDF